MRRRSLEEEGRPPALRTAQAFKKGHTREPSFIPSSVEMVGGALIDAIATHLHGLKPHRERSGRALCTQRRLESERRNTWSHVGSIQVHVARVVRNWLGLHALSILQPQSLSLSKSFPTIRPRYIYLSRAHTFTYAHANIAKDPTQVFLQFFSLFLYIYIYPHTHSHMHMPWTPHKFLSRRPLSHWTLRAGSHLG